MLEFKSMCDTFLLPNLIASMWHERMTNTRGNLVWTVYCCPNKARSEMVVYFWMLLINHTVFTWVIKKYFEQWNLGESGSPQIDHSYLNLEDRYLPAISCLLGNILFMPETTVIIKIRIKKQASGFNDREKERQIGLDRTQWMRYTDSTYYQWVLGKPWGRKSPQEWKVSSPMGF